MRGAPHIHGILWVDIDQIIKEDKAGGSKKLEILGEALQTMHDDKLPSDEEKYAAEREKEPSVIEDSKVTKVYFVTNVQFY